MRLKISLIRGLSWFALLFLFIGSLDLFGQVKIEIRGWTILSDSYEDDINTIKAAKAYNINHLQLSHDILMDLREIRDPKRQKLANDLRGASCTVWSCLRPRR